MNPLHAILIDEDRTVLLRFLQSILLFLQETYGDQLFTLLQYLETQIHSDIPYDNMLLVFLFTLNYEDPMQQFILRQSPQGVAKQKMFYQALRYHTNELLDFHLTPTKYIECCRSAWLIS